MDLKNRSLLNEMMKINSAERIPNRDECEEMMIRYSMLPNIVDHSRQVMRVCLAITDNLHQDVSLNRELVVAAALLHDITKTRSLQTKEKHALSGGILLRELGYPRIAEIVAQHVTIPDLNLDGQIEEREIVYYADKRVMHDRVVSIHERVDDLIRRYATGEDIRRRIMQNKEQTLAIERKIARFMKIDINDAIRSIS